VERGQHRQRAAVDRRRAHDAGRVEGLRGAQGEQIRHLFLRTAPRRIGGAVQLAAAAERGRLDLLPVAAALVPQRSELVHPEREAGGDKVEAAGEADRVFGQGGTAAGVPDWGGEEMNRDEEERMKVAIYDCDEVFRCKN